MPAVPTAGTRRRHHRVGHRPARQGAHQRRPRGQMLDTTDEWIVERTGIRERRVGGTTRRPVDRGRPPGARAWPGSTRRRSTAWCWPPPRPTAPCRPRSATVQDELGLRCGAFDVNAACSGFVYGAGRRPRPDRHRRRAGARHRHRHAARGSPTGTTATPPSCSPTAPAPSCSRRSRAAASCSAGTSTPTARAERSSTPRSAATSRWTARRSSAGPCGSWSTRPRSRWSTPASPPTTSRSSCPTRPTSASSRRPATGSASRWTAPPSCSTAPATRRRRRSRWPWPTPSTTAASHDGDLVLLVGFGAGMTAASAVIRVGRRR